MSKWLERLREHEKKRQMAGDETDETPIIGENGILGVLSVRSGGECANCCHSEQVAGEEDASLYEERAAILEYDCGLAREGAIAGLASVIGNSWWDKWLQYPNLPIRSFPSQTAHPYRDSWLVPSRRASTVCPRDNRLTIKIEVDFMDGAAGEPMGAI
ncbi:hypothetical protein [Bosea sp. (in: a-proteobacteria)]|uniref:hypothetical protein n=1 Tax=Bosea sp. (in: a-proteobacteria) TaxID=1871050 RepID=UPI002B458E73|nr:hypothetical protein [Bosea sp. (in: a-proteobacteria)]WRH56695.1 MAG: hypothetical protein RSE11_16835 [Bosea sp. (in: a-proteobacteria)]